MDIALLSKMVSEIILDEDEVTLPGIGTFIAEIVPSTFSDKGYTINPPYRRLYFNQKQGSDTLLADFYARSNSISRETAARIVTAFLQELKETLKERKAVVFPGLGRLRATRENYFFFVPDEDLDIYPYGFGLERISLKTHVETEDEVAAAVGELAEILEGPKEEIPGQARNDGQPTVAEDQPAVTKEQTNAAVEQPASAEAAPEKNETKEKPERRHLGLKIFLWTLIVIFALAALLLGAFLLAAQLWPDLVDSLLYSPEELELIRSMQI